MKEIKSITKEEFFFHIEEMRRITGHDGSAPRSKRQRVNVREMVAAL